MLLSDADISQQIGIGRIRVDPYRPENLQPASLDITLDSRFVQFHASGRVYIDPLNPDPNLFGHTDVGPDGAYILQPGEFALASTTERIRLPNDIAARLEGKSSLGRIGLMVHSTAGFIDPGWQGQLTLELSNLARLPIQLTPGMKIGQLSFIRLSSPCRQPYGSPSLGSRYQNQDGPTPSRPEQPGAPNTAGTPQREISR